MQRFACLLGLVFVLAGPACGGDDEEAAAPAAADPTQLDVEVTEAASQPIRMTLRCGDRCDVAKLDEVLEGAADGDRVCTQQYGGPEKARVTGTVEGRKVDFTLTRNDGCAIRDYELLFAAFGREAPIGG